MCVCWTQFTSCQRQGRREREGEQQSQIENRRSLSEFPFRLERTEAEDEEEQRRGDRKILKQEEE